MFRIDAVLLIPGRGEPVTDGSIVFDGDTISYVGAQSNAPSRPATEVVQVPVVMPGLWECHGHFFGTSTLDLHEIMRLPVAVAAARASKNPEAALLAGFTSVREAGGL